MVRKTRNHTASSGVGKKPLKGKTPYAKEGPTAVARTEVPEAVVEPESGFNNGSTKGDDDELVNSVAVSEKDCRVRKRALDLLRGAQSSGDDNGKEGGQSQQQQAPHDLQQYVELPVMYAALKRIKEIGIGGNGIAPNEENDADPDLTDEDRQLIQDASLAVPYMMYKRFYEHLMLPRTMGGLAFSDAKAKKIARDIFLAMGPACCKESMTDQDLCQACPSVKPIDALKILPSLKAVGKEARSQLDQIESLLSEGMGNDDEDEDDEDMEEEEFEGDEHEDPGRISHRLSM
ncbi:hypothetical protein ACA910_003816 [Epithemia clementina (nom. ined.)]